MRSNRLKRLKLKLGDIYKATHPEDYDGVFSCYEVRRWRATLVARGEQSVKFDTESISCSEWDCLHHTELLPMDFPSMILVAQTKSLHSSESSSQRRHICQRSLWIPQYAVNQFSTLHSQVNLQKLSVRNRKMRVSWTQGLQDI